MQQSDQYRDKGRDKLRAALQIYVKAESSEWGGAEGKGDCEGTAVFLISEEQTACLITVSGESQLGIDSRRLQSGRCFMCKNTPPLLRKGNQHHPNI